MAIPINERLKAVRTALKLSQRDFSKNIPIEQSSLARMEKGNTRINPRIIELIVSKYRVNKDWFLTGKGEMFSESPPDVRLEQINQIYNELNELFKDYLKRQARELLDFQRRNEKQGKKPQ